MKVFVNKSMGKLQVKSLEEFLKILMREFLNKSLRGIAEYIHRQISHATRERFPEKNP